VPPPWRRLLEPIYERLEALRSVIDWPDPESDAEDWIFAMSALIFVEPTKSERALQVLRHTEFLYIDPGYARDCREAVGFRQVGLSRQPDPVPLQGAVVCLPLAVLPGPLLHRSSLRISGRLRLCIRRCFGRPTEQSEALAYFAVKRAQQAQSDPRKPVWIALTVLRSFNDLLS
jgi:hypothetical protein